MELAPREPPGVARTYTNPVYPGYFADPFVWEHGGAYYAVGTGAAEAARAVEGPGGRVFPVLLRIKRRE